MNASIAKQLFTEGGTLVLLNVPEGTELGIDMKTWNVGEKFRGIKMIPPGIHFINYSAVDVYGETAPKVGFFYNFKKSEFVVKKWDKDLEDVSIDAVDEKEVVQLKSNITTLDQFLGPYPYDVWKKWVSLTSHITENLLKKLTPLSGKVRSALDLESCSDINRPRKSTSTLDTPTSSTHRRKLRTSISEETGDDLLPDLKAMPGTELRFTSFPEQHYPEGSTPAEITQHSLDLSYVLEKMIAQHTNDTDLVGELQFSYICFLVGHSLEAFEHWKKLVNLLCSCETAIKKHREVFDIFISTLEAQILETPEEFLADIVSNNNIIYMKLRNLFRTVHDIDIDGRFKTKINRFKMNLTKKYKWDFSHLESEDEDEAPVIVET